MKDLERNKSDDGLGHGLHRSRIPEHLGGGTTFEKAT